MDPDTFLDRAVELGFDSVMLDPAWGRGGLISDKDTTHLAAALKSRHLLVVPRATSNKAGFMASEDSGERAVAYYADRIRTAPKLGASIVRVVGGVRDYVMPGWDLPGRLPRSAILDRLIAALSELVTVAVQEDVTLALENHGDLRCEEMLRVLKDVKSPKLKVHLDVAEMVGFFERPLDTIARLLPHTVTMHFQNMKSRKIHGGWEVFVCGPKEGWIDLDEVARMTKDQAHDIIVFDSAASQTPQKEADTTIAYAEYMQELFA